ncbi:MAG TPA: GntR family transcriptional regulator [Pirellulaceae bacterium]|jgi:GntR family transcriptional regulator|nr:GntR family transcriptional regulator [Pirellulaceae bacterium]
MTPRIQPDNHVPVYLQIVEHVRSAIAAGVYRPGEALPSLRVLATDLKVNPNTVQRAYDELDRQGLIESRRGVGIFVAKRGARSARGRAEESIHAAFAQAIGSAHAAGLSSDQIRELFDDSLEEVLAESGGRA